MLEAAEETLDIMEVNFSLELICALDLLNDDVCSYDNALDYMNAIMISVENNHTKVRVLVEKVNSNGMENRVAAKELYDHSAAPAAPSTGSSKARRK